PWGGGYGPNEFSDIGWASWNDQFRNGVKGQNPHDGHGFIFGKWQGTNNRKSLERYVMGSLREFGGQYLDIDHSVNYLESHDDHTMSDFIRLGLDEIDEKTSIINIDDHSKLTPLQLKLNKLAAIFLFTSQGAIMMHAGQEFARSKVTAKTVSADSNWGRIDHNSYDKDNETNYINFHHAEMNSELLNYYRGLIQLRSGNAAFRNAKPADIAFNDHPDSLLVAYELN
ncbi:MAG: pullulanase, partial [Aliifodinibius sp.]|nr:pullulanase [candidate division Zixibacteria bacterium]NIT57957.1 pullulanase [Fodinibius sp.]NIW45544.1 pullulanase [Gammaproteobacteria bacterium]NIS47249.1 pullulanase [candidate division Zixibacteria bacterium]NIU14698.1 pullulanase [candidate division Zixibacteria bacterium]